MKDVSTNVTGYYDPEACDLQEFIALIDQTTKAADVPHAAFIEKSVPIYDMNDLRALLDNPNARKTLMSEWAHVLNAGAGVIVLKNTYADTTVLDEATAIYQAIIAQEKENTGGGGDHFAAAGANDRVWNALQKLCEAAPNVFLRYFANATIAAVCEAWLGPNYQMTAQVNLVYPGGAAQQAHRDYHLGFQTAEVSASYPAHVHDVSPILTLQGAVAHCDMPVESGPTKLLPFSQAYGPGYLAYRLPEFVDLFEEMYVQLPLAKGDALFFSPALFHGAGDNVSADIQRMANLLQVSCAYGRAMEAMDRTAMSRALYPMLKPGPAAEAAIASCAEGYSFPTNLDTDPPVGGLAPETQAALMRRALSQGMSVEAFNAALTEQEDRRRP